MLKQMLRVQLEIPINVISVSGHDENTPFEWSIESDPLSGEVIKFRVGHWGAHIQALQLAHAFDDAVTKVTSEEKEQMVDTKTDGESEVKE